MNKPSLGKCWVLEDPIFVWQLQLTSAEGRKKVFLLLDTRQASRGARLVEAKPEDAKPQSAPVELTRKYVPSGHLNSIRQDPASGHLWLELRSQDHVHWHVLLASKPPELLLVNSQRELLFQFGTKGTFTKKKPLGEEVTAPLESWPDLLPGLLRGDVVAPKAAAADDDAQSGLQRELRQKLRRRQKMLKKTLAKQQQHIPSAAEMEQAKAEALVLQQVLSQIPEGAATFTVPAEWTGLGTITLQLDPDLPRAKWLEQRFTRVKKQQRAIELGQAQLEKVRQDLAATEKASESLLVPLATETLAEIAKRLRIPIDLSPQREESKAEKKLAAFKRFELAQGFFCLIGRSALENDALTKAARGDDLWVHVVGITGTHVIIPTQRRKSEGAPAAVIRQAAILALHHSKYKDDMAGEVYVTPKANLKKRKGMPAGLWIVERSETLYIKYTPDERDEIYRQQ